MKNKLNILLIVLITTGFSTSFAFALNLHDVLTGFSQIRQRTANFREEKHTFYLDEPLTSSGRMEFLFPDKLSKFILSPEIITQKIIGTELQIQTEHQFKTVNMDEYPEFSIILNTIKHLFTGNRAALEKNFTITFKAKKTNWNILLAPIDKSMAGYVKQIEIIGSNNRLNRITILEPNDNKTITHVFNHR